MKNAAQFHVTASHSDECAETVEFRSINVHLLKTVRDLIKQFSSASSIGGRKI